MFNYKKLIYTWISFHGITDLLLPIKSWLPYYIIVPLTIYIPINILNFVTILSSTLHFSQDLPLSFNNILLLLGLLISLGEYKVIQNLFIFFMCFIHVPIHLYQLNYNYYDCELLICTFVIFYNCDSLIYTIKIIVDSGGRKPNNNIHKLLLGIINAHILTNNII